MTIVEFLEARIAEDEALARAVTDGPEWTVDEQSFIVISGDGPICYDVSSDEVSQHIARHDPARILAECAAKRAIIAECREDHEDAMSSRNDVTEVASEVLYALAAVYKDHPDYSREWTP